MQHQIVYKREQFILKFKTVTF